MTGFYRENMHAKYACTMADSSKAKAMEASNPRHLLYRVSSSRWHCGIRVAGLVSEFVF